MATERPHGTRLRYTHGPDINDKPGKGCRCARCRRAASADRERHRMETNTGVRRPLADAGRVKAHLQALRDAGADNPTIAEQAGVSVHIVKELQYANPPRVKLRPEHEDALLAVTVESLVWVRRSQAAGTQRRLRALAVLGFPSSVLAAHTGLHRDHIQRLLAADEPMNVTADTARQVVAAHGLLWRRHPSEFGVPAHSISLVRNLAKAKGWVSLLAWDDIDNPDAKPVRGERGTRYLDLLEDSNELVRQGLTVAAAAKRLGLDANALRAARSKAARRQARAGVGA